MSFNQLYGPFSVLAVAMVMLTSCEKDVPTRNIDVEIRAIMDERNLPSVSACILNANGVVWQKTYGYADLSGKVPATFETVYHVASISKLVVAMAIMQLEEQGMVDLDADVDLYLPVSIRNPHFPETPITLRMLLTHSAGIAWPQTSQEAGALWEHFEPDQAPRPSEWVPEFLVPGGENYNPNIWKNTRPGTFELYSNIGVNVIAYVVEQVSGMEFRSYCRQRIFYRLDMYSTSFNYADLNTGHLARLYYPNYAIVAPFDDRIAASGLLKTSTADFSKFLMAYLNGGELNGIRILKKSTIDKLLQIQNPVTGVCLLWKAGVGGWFGHTGGMDGAATATDLHMEDQVGMIIFTNTHDGSVYPGHDIYGLVRQKANMSRN